MPRGGVAANLGLSLILLLLHMGVLGVAAALSWWLSGYDAKLTGEDERRDLLRRGIRCAVTLVLVEVAFTSLARWALYREVTSGYTYIALAIPLGVSWAGCLSELFARGFQGLIFTEDSKPADLGSTERALDQLAALVHEGKREEAIQLCRQLQDSGEASGLALEAVLSRLGVAPTAEGGTGKLRPLDEADVLRNLGRLHNAEAHLVALLKQEPANQAAALMLMRLYAQDLHAPAEAHAVLQSIAGQKFVPLGFLEYAQRSLEEWTRPGSKPRLEQSEPELGTREASKPIVGPESSVDELLDNGYLGTAVELLEQKLKGRPYDFMLWMRLAEVQGVRCGNLAQAGKIIERMERNSGCSSEQVRLAQAKLREWKAAAGR